MLPDSPRIAARLANAPLPGAGLALSGLGAGLALLGLGLGYPLCTLVMKSLRTATGEFAGAENFRLFFQTPGLVACLTNTLGMGLTVTAATVVLAFTLAYAVTHTRARGRKALALLCLLPLFVPSVFPSLGLIYLFGNQGLFKGLLGSQPLYGPLGVFLGGVVYALPHAVLLLVSSLRDIDGKLYQAARTLGAGPARRFATVTLPGARYGIVSACIVVFVLTISDFGVPKVLGGDFSMLATEAFKQMIGQQNFGMGATISMVLLLPSVVAFALDAWARSRQPASGAENFRPGAKNPGRDAAFTLLGWAVLLLPLTVLGTVVWGSFIGFWPYDLSFTLENYAFRESVYGLIPYWNSLKLAAGTALFGTVFLFCVTYALERCPVFASLGIPYRLFALLPLCVPGTVLGLSYIFAFNRPDGPAGALYGSLALLIFNSVIHFYTVGHLAFSGSLSRMDPAYERAGVSLGVPRRVTFFRVILPLQRKTLLEVGFYFFVNALTTISAVIFLYSPDSVPASVAVLQMFDSGKIAEASAMGSLILFTALGARLVFSLGGRPRRQS